MKGLILPLIALLCSACERPSPATEGLAVADALGGDAVAGFERALNPRRFSFPEDHNAHPTFRNEWWYLTGHLAAADGERFGYQVTFFRIALAPGEPEQDSAWATNQVWMAHAALTEIDGAEHHHEARFARGALGLAGQTRAPFRIWLDDWQLLGGDEGDFPWQVRLSAADFALDLALTPEREPLLQGKNGLSQKSGEAGNASYYYSMTRLNTTGSIARAGDSRAVSGRSWLDREWSTSALGDDQVGWDWFSLQLDTGHDLMIYRLRGRDGQTDPLSAGTLLTNSGKRRPLDAGDFQLEPSRWWTSATGARYPVAWRLRVAGADLDFRIEALLDDQEMATGIQYWEGAVGVWDTGSGEHLGQGYLEMTGYEDGS